MIGERNGQHLTIFSKDSIQNNSMLKSYQVANFTTLKTIKALPNLAYFNGKKILIIDSLVIYSLNKKPNVIILTKSPKLNLERLF
ncbi:hypothetical protein ACFQZF_04980 [Flavobacterium myungsuense]|uniref:hypothetical protein n=1 Tax=Flavobacterium myungsuense TaxID=651823 RepID=UPI00363D3B6A